MMKASSVSLLESLRPHSCRSAINGTSKLPVSSLRTPGIETPPTFAPGRLRRHGLQDRAAEAPNVRLDARGEPVIKVGLSSPVRIHREIQRHSLPMIHMRSPKSQPCFICPAPSARIRWSPRRPSRALETCLTQSWQNPARVLTEFACKTETKKYYLPFWSRSSTQSGGLEDKATGPASNKQSYQLRLWDAMTAHPPNQSNTAGV